MTPVTYLVVDTVVHEEPQVHPKDLCLISSSRGQGKEEKISHERGGDGGERHWEWKGARLKQNPKVHT